MITTSYQLKDFFFDRLKVQALVDKQTHEFLYRAGGRVRTISIRSMRKVGKKGLPSTDGQPPKWHGNSNFSLRKILFGFDGRNSVIVGPVRGNAKLRNSLTVPELHEFGGTQTINTPVYTPSGSGRVLSQAQKDSFRRLIKEGRLDRLKRTHIVKRHVKYPRRAFMGPGIRVLKAKYPEYAKVWFGGSGGIGSAEAA